MKRFKHAIQTIPQNLKDNEEDSDKIELDEELSSVSDEELDSEMLENTVNL